MPYGHHQEHSLRQPTAVNDMTMPYGLKRGNGIPFGKKEWYDMPYGPQRR
jgi:hypothetical protein